MRTSVRGGGRPGWTQAAIAVTAALTMTACGSGSGGDGESAGAAGDADNATLTFVNAQDPGTFDKVIAAFEKANPGITIEQQVVPFDDLNSTVQSRLQSEDPGIDLYDVDEPRLASFASRGYLVDLSDIGAEAEGVIDPTALEATQYDGKQYAMPRWTSTQMLYYNKDVLQQAGIEAPGTTSDARMTWQEVAEAGKKAQQAGAKWGFTFDQVDRYYQLQPLPESLGAGPGLTGEGLLEADVTNDGWVQAMEWYSSLFEEGISPRGIPAEQTGPLFAQGETAFFAGGPWNAATFNEAGTDYGVSPYPYFEGGEPASSTGSWATGISPFSENQAAAKKFISYMTTDPTGAWEVSSNNIPVQQEAFQKYLATVRKAGPVGADLADMIELELGESAVSRPTTAAYVDFETVMNKAFADIRNGEDPAERLQSASEELDAALAKYEQ